MKTHLHTSPIVVKMPFQVNVTKRITQSLLALFFIGVQLSSLL